ncbi:sorbitol-6-phosphate dehydrogenase [Actinobacillus seminis]|uniref:Sorbitol-6-phosphate dehydrogenase n=1 Tax=Actinobacillus seminis TaxID=722 RepID=A0A380VIY5_9PAST|nr:sorbitol-6-phosphate dehydrogenase [Actinobacillus seminis]
MVHWVVSKRWRDLSRYDNGDLAITYLTSCYAEKLGILESEVEQVYINKVPLKRGCDYQDVLNVLKFYASEEASYCTGQSINITGGQVMF